MKARNRRTGAAVRTTLERIYGSSPVIEESFEQSDDGAIGFTQGDGTELCWDTAGTVERNGETIFIDENGDEVRASEVELHD